MRGSTSSTDAGGMRVARPAVQVIEGDLPPMEELERERLARDASFGPDIRLSCQVRVESDMTVRVLGRAAESGMTPGTRPLD